MSGTAQVVPGTEFLPQTDRYKESETHMKNQPITRNQFAYDFPTFGMYSDLTRVACAKLVRDACATVANQVRALDIRVAIADEDEAKEAVTSVLRSMRDADPKLPDPFQLGLTATEGRWAMHDCVKAMIAK